MLPSLNPTKMPSWQKLEAHFTRLKKEHLKNLFLNNPGRFNELSVKLPHFLFDFSKNRITLETLKLFKDLFEECQVTDAIAQQFDGSKINVTEGRAVLHTALRNQSDKAIWVDDQNVMPAIEEVRQQMHDFSDLIISGNWKGFNGKTVKNIVNIGIGGSDLGPAMVYEALKPYHNHLNCYFVSNVDEAHLAETLKGLDPSQTLFVIASKTFTTQETMTNAHSAREWFLRSQASELDVAKHFVAVSTNKAEVEKFGIDPTNMFVFWDWVGGRYSVWSAIGLSLCCGLGYKNFEKLLAGAFQMDNHFKNAPFEKNVPMLMAAIGIWYTNFFKAETEALIPYNQNMHRFAAYFQQGNMESNGKYVNRKGQKVNYATGPVVWGEPGTNGQHAFFQLMHQGTHLIPADFIAFAESNYPSDEHQQKLLANFLAQTEALMQGKTLSEASQELEKLGLSKEKAAQLAPYRVFDGNRPSTSIVGEKLTPESLGCLMAAYEHKIFVQGVIWNIYSFDQWGVELGKQLAGSILPALKSTERVTAYSASTNGLTNFIKQNRAE
jgi:glucose-6-phosphate isomerase